MFRCVPVFVLNKCWIRRTMHTNLLFHVALNSLRHHTGVPPLLVARRMVTALW